MEKAVGRKEMVLHTSRVCRMVTAEKEVAVPTDDDIVEVKDEGSF